jgi:methyl-accepting chemotaxis protein
MASTRDGSYTENQILDALNKSQGIIEFAMDGIVMHCNEIFLNVLGYTLEEVKGKHHRMFCEESYVNSQKYTKFWQSLNKGEQNTGEYRRNRKNGKEVFIQASYNPIKDENGKLQKVVTFVSDITEIKKRNTEYEGKLRAIDKSQATIEFNMDGTVITANERFLDIIGYNLAEIKDKHHRMFCEETYANSHEYKEFWEKLNRGEFDSGEYKRIGKNGEEAYIQATYNPIFDLTNKPIKVIKFATDITERKIRNAEFEGIQTAINKSQGTVEFNMNGTIISANERFLEIVNYTLDDIKGKHHRMFCDETYVNSHEYTEFWEKLNKGEYDDGEYKRVGKNGKEAYLQASYNPIFDLNNKPYKVIKFATDVTDRKIRNAEFEGVMSAINKSQGTIEFNMDGTIITANEKFLSVVGYTLEEIKGKHHRIFCEDSYTFSPEYSAFWEKLNNGEFDTGVYKRIGKNNKEVYIQATYNPIFDLNNKPMRVIKFATDVTDRKVLNAEFESKLSAIDKSQGTIEFTMEGIIKTANEKFLAIVGYTLDEIVGKHHRIFCEELYANSNEYKEFWQKLNRGEFDTGEYKRLGKDGREAFIQATYNPIFDLNNKPVRVLKIASDVTEKKRRENESAKQAALIMDMSTPVMRLWDNILLLPIIGLLDSKRVQLIMEAALQNILDYQARFIILDIQGVPAIDSAVANYLIKVTKATKLMGCNCIVTGMSPQISQALVNLGIELGDIMTQSNLKDGVSTSLKQMGLKLQSNKIS